MKIIILKLSFLLIPVLTIAQSPVQQLFDEYSGKDGYTTVYITKYMFQLFAKVVDDEEDKDLKDVVEGLNSIRILTRSDNNGGNSKSFYDEILRAIPANYYDDLMIIKDGKEEVKFMVHEKGDIIDELLMVIGGDGEALLMSLQGDIDLKKVSKLSKSMDIKGMDHLDKMEEERKE